MRQSPYLGVTGIVSTEDVCALNRCWSSVRDQTRRFLMAGVLVSAKTLRGESTESRRYPKLGALSELLEGLAEFAWPVVHYNTRATGEDLTRELFDLSRYLSSSVVCGLQLNVVRPADSAFRNTRHLFNKRILQVNTSSLGEGDVREYAGQYAGAVDHALIDLSGGTGKPLDPDWLAETIGPWSFWQTCGIRPGLAGGLGPDCARVLSRFAQRVGPEVWRGVSVDAESGLRVPVDDPVPGAKHQDRLCPERVQAYLEGAVYALG